MYRNIKIINTGSYCPDLILDNEHFINYFKTYNLDVKAKKLLNKLGVNKRKLACKGETTLSMSIESCKDVLKKSNLEGKDVDIIISATNTPEYLTPCCAIMLQNKLNSNAALCFDINCDCIGMLHAIDTATKFMKVDKKYKRALVVGSFLYNKFSREDNLITYGVVGDNSIAILLEAQEEEEEAGFLTSKTYTDSSFNEFIRFPACGLSNIFNKNIDIYDKKIDWKPFNANIFSEIWVKLIKSILNDYKLNSNDIEDYFMSQFSLEQIKNTMTVLKVPIEKASYIGDRYGYTGPTSPLLALHLKLKEKQYHKNDLCIFCSVAGGFSMTTLLYKW